MPHSIGANLLEKKKKQPTASSTSSDHLLHQVHKLHSIRATSPIGAAGPGPMLSPEQATRRHRNRSDAAGWRGVAPLLRSRSAATKGSRTVTGQAPVPVPQGMVSCRRTASCSAAWRAAARLRTGSRSAAWRCILAALLRATPPFACLPVAPALHRRRMTTSLPAASTRKLLCSA
jgi:hypothetical protein